MRSQPSSKKHCQVVLPPSGCPGIFPTTQCQTPMIQLDQISSISCEGVITGRVLCDFAPISGVEVTLSSSSDVVMFEDTTPITDRTGRFTTRVSIPKGTSFQQVTITAKTSVANVMISDSIQITVDCVFCREPLLTLISPVGKVGCMGEKLKGSLLCDGVPIANAPISFQIISSSRNIFLSPNPAITEQDGSYSTTLIPTLGVNETITIVASATVGGKKVTAVLEDITVRCQKCKKPKIELDDSGLINCKGTISGRLTCDGEPINNVVVNLTSTSVLEFDTPNPITDANGEFSSVARVPEGTASQSVSYKATATVDGKTVSKTGMVEIVCESCVNPHITLKVLTKVVECSGAKLEGKVTCDGKPVENAEVFINIQPPGARVKVDPNPAITKENGVYITTLTPEGNVDQTISVIASVTIGEKTVSTDPQDIKVNCKKCKDPKIILDDSDFIKCEGTISGKVTCDGNPVKNEVVYLSSESVLNFTTPNPVTNDSGEFSSVVTVPPGTSLQKATYSATTRISGVPVSEMGEVKVVCNQCENLSVTLNTPEDKIDCKGADINGKVTCDDAPLANVKVFFSVVTSKGTVTIKPNPAITREDGTYSANLLPSKGSFGKVKVIANVTVEDREAEAGPNHVNVYCPKHKKVPCKIHLKTQGNHTAKLRVIQNEGSKEYHGFMKLDVNGKCGECDFTGNGFVIHFQSDKGEHFTLKEEKRKSIYCEDHYKVAIVNGVVEGKLYDGNQKDYLVTIWAKLDELSNQVIWEFIADDGEGTIIETASPYITTSCEENVIEPCNGEYFFE
ncbi:hypothetical protein [Pontibacillus yanchengensis]|uniref:Big-1 domain-containing protein n=1 Tax=Pontibacillus yanchengensis Y32 TaxID=1385514 RepID=A0A0A2TG68_9BACI|nr:hypothetical protein [Pontibacillus yanchengensis]KGP73106.1 hypothetical protein N782_07475 [Pontibacillus yanchengensis Y32]